MPTLTYLNTEAEGESVLIPKERFSVGRDPNSDLSLDDLSVSANHAEVRRDKNIWSLRDAGSSNGTNHNGSKTFLAIIKNGDRIGFGDVLFRFDTEPSLDVVENPFDAAKNQTRLVEMPDDSALIDAGDAEVDAIEWTQERRALLHRAMKPYQIGGEENIDLMLSCLLARGHAMLSGPCGLARLRMSEAFARLLDLDLRQLQSEKDLTHHGHLLLARGLHDLPTNTRASLFSLMRHHKGTGDQQREPFMVLGTRETMEPLNLSPAQLNMFLADIHLTYPTRSQEENLLAGLMEEVPLDPVIQRAQMVQLQQVVEEMAVGSDVLQKAVDLLRATRPREPESSPAVADKVFEGAGPSAGRMLLLAAKAWAFIHGRIDVSLADLRQLMVPVLAHRLVMRDGANAEAVLSQIADEIELPTH